MALKLLFLLMAFAPGIAFGEEDFLGNQLPKFEAGLAVGAFYLPDYPGADESQNRILPMPYFIYRGDVLRADRGGGIRGRFLNGERLEFDVSFGAAFPVSADDNEARAGMPALDWIGEFGPRLIYHIFKSPIIKIDFRLPVRYVFSTDIENWHERGFTFTPEIGFQHRALFDNETTFQFRTGPMWATEELMDYFYEVPAQYATAARPFYNAQPGYMGYNVRVSATHRFTKKVFGFLGVSQNYFRHAENRESPLLRDLVTQSYFVGFSWGLYESKEVESVQD